MLAQPVVLTAQPFIHPDSVPINFIQTLGSHNSYRIRMQKGIYNALRLLDLFYGKKSTPADQLNYSHASLPEQLGVYGMRSFELDIHYDPEGGLYYKRYGNFLAFKRKSSGIEALKKPGMKLLHIADVDYNTHYYTFKEALVAIRDWSKQHPSHLPIYILVEPKEEGPGNRVKFPKFVKVLPFDQTALEAVDVEIKEVFGADTLRVFRPDDLRGSFSSLREAISAKGWPKLKDMRGKIIFVINGKMHHTDLYAQGHPQFAGRMMFSFSKKEKSDAAFVKHDNPYHQDIPELVNNGYIIRSRTDSPGKEAMQNDYRTSIKAIESGAQILSTDYYKPDYSLSEYKVQLPGGSKARLCGKFQGYVPNADWE